MLQIRINNQFLDLGPNTKIQLTFRNPMFNNKKDGSASYPFTVPDTLNNQRILGSYSRITSKEVKTSFPNCELLFDGLGFISGILTINRSVNNDFDCSLGMDKGEFNYYAKNKKLTELNYPASTYNFKKKGDAGSILNTTHQQYPDSPFVIFPVYNPGLYKDSWFHPFFTLNKEEFLTILDAYPTWLLNDPSAPHYFFMLKVAGIINDYIDPQGNQMSYIDDFYNKVNEFYANQDRYSTSPPTYPYYMVQFILHLANFMSIFGPPPTNWNYDLVIPFPESGWVNYIDIDVLTHDYKPGKIIVPFPYLAEAITKSINELGYSPGNIHFLNDEELKTLVLTTMNIAVSIAYPDYPTGTFDITLNEHMPDITICDFLTQVCGFFNCSLFIKKDRTIDIRRNIDILRDPAIKEFSSTVIFQEKSYSRNSYKFHISHSADEYFNSNIKQEGIARFRRLQDVWAIADLPDPFTIVKEINVVCFVVAAQIFFITTFSDNGFAWVPYSYKDSDLTVFEEYADQTTKDFNVGYFLKSYSWYISHTAYIFDQLNLLYPYWEFPRCDFQGNQNLHSISFDLDYTPLQSIILMFYRGYRHFLPNPAANADMLPCGSADNMRGSDIDPTVKYSLAWDGPAGIYENFWKEWIEWLNSTARPATITKKLTPEDMMNIQWPVKHSIFGVLFFLVEIRVDIDVHKISLAEIDIIRA